MKMIKVAIVDDNEEDLKSAINYFVSYLKTNHSELANKIQIDKFSSAVDFLQNYQANKYDLLILDICMKGINGMKAAQIVRMRDRDCKIIFLTNSEEFLLDGYLVFASGYIMKPIAENEENFAKTFEYILPDLLDKVQILKVIIKNIPLAVPYKKIFYVDINEKHSLRLHFDNQSVVTNISYKDCQSQLLQDKRFLECYHRIIVNMDHIKSMENDVFVLKNNSRVPISQRRRRETKLKYMQYLAHN